MRLQKTAATSSTVAKKRAASTSAAVPKKKAKTLSKSPDSQPSMSRASSSRTNTEDIDTNECCVCFRTFTDDALEGTGLEWVKCVCGRWLHEECISYDIATDANGEELLCPFCCV